MSPASETMNACQSCPRCRRSWGSSVSTRRPRRHVGDRRSISVLKTFDPPPHALAGARRRGVPARQVRRPRVRRRAPGLPPGAGGLAALVRRDAQHRAPAGQVTDRAAGPARRRAGFDLTEAGTKKRLAAYLVATPPTSPASPRLGPDPTGRRVHPRAFGAILAGRRTQVKGLLRDQSVHRRDRQRLLRRDPARRARCRRSPSPRTSTPRTWTGCMPRCATPWPPRSPPRLGQAGQGAQGRQARGDAGARPHRRDLPGLRRHRA